MNLINHHPPVAFHMGDHAGGAMKGSGGRGLQLTKEELKMTLFTNETLRKKSVLELRGLYCSVFNALIRSERGSANRRNALASLENITRELNARLSGPSP